MGRQKPKKIILNLKKVILYESYQRLIPEQFLRYLNQRVFNEFIFRTA